MEERKARKVVQKAQPTESDRLKERFITALASWITLYDDLTFAHEHKIHDIVEYQAIQQRVMEAKSERITQLEQTVANLVTICEHLEQRLQRLENKLT